MNPQERKKKTSKEVLLKLWPYLVATVLFAAISFWFFSWGQDIHLAKKGYVIDNELFGTYGDFFGGVLGTIFTLCTVLLMINTFRHQREETIKSGKRLDIQRFHDLFFELLRLYQSQVSELCGNAENKEEQTTIRYNNKDFFDFEKESIQRKFRNRKSFAANQSAALSYYMLFYIANRTKLGAYYRTLFRIYDLIDSSELEEPVKRDYLKIMRAQLTESELFFLRYNAMTFYGRHFIDYINTYHILKHLPAFELFEFKDWWDDLNPVERTGMNIVFSSLSRTIRDNIDKDVTNLIVPPFSKDDKYVLSLTCRESSDVLLTMRVYKDRTNYYNELKAFDSFDVKRIQRLLDCFIKEIFIYSNFQRYNPINTVETYSDPILQVQDGEIINSGIRGLSNRRLIVSGPNKCKDKGDC